MFSGLGLTFGLTPDCLASFSCRIASLWSGVRTMLLMSLPSSLSRISLLSAEVRMMLREAGVGVTLGGSLAGAGDWLKGALVGEGGEGLLGGGGGGGGVLGSGSFTS